MVIWLIGKSCAGKTSVGRVLHGRLKRRMPNVVFLDGDELRAAVGEDLSYSVRDRYVSERRTSRLCKLLADQGIHVICAKLSNSPEMREWNRCNIRDYCEVYLRADDAVLEANDVKGLYRGYRQGRVSSVVGMDIPFNEPVAPWMTVNNDRHLSCEQIADEIMQRLHAAAGATKKGSLLRRLIERLLPDAGPRAGQALAVGPGV